MNTRREPEPARPRFGTGAATARDDLVIVTVAWDGERFSMCEAKSARLALTSRRQDHVRRFMADLDRFFAETGINQVLVFGAQETGKREFRGNPRRVSMETMLLLITGVTTALAEPASLSSWKSHFKDLMPPASKEMTIWEEDLLNAGILAACVATTGSPSPSWLKQLR